MTVSFKSAVAGESYRNADGSSRQSILRRCRAGERILLEPEPDNPWDPDAVRVLRASGEQIGYLPAGHNLAAQIARGEVTAVLFAVTGGEGGWFSPRKMRGAVLEITRPRRVWPKKQK